MDNTTITRYLRTARLELSGSKVIFAAAATLLMANLSALIDLVFHPDIPYLEEEHLIVGGITALLTAVLFAILTMYLTNSRISERRLRSLFDVSTDFVQILDTRGLIIQTNQAVVDKSGYSKRELIGHGINEFLAPSSREIFEKHFPVLMDSGSCRVEVEVVFKDGRIGVMDCQATAMRDRDGKITSLMVVQRDITERKRTEAEIIQAVNEWKRTFDAIPDLVSILDTQYRFVRINKAMADKLGAAPEDIVGSLCYNVVHGLDSPPSYCPHLKMMEDGQEHSAEIYEKRIGGDCFVTVSPLHDAHGLMSGCVHVARNITERKRAEKVLQKSEKKLREVTSSLDEGLYVLDEQGDMTYMNPAAEKLLGWTEAELLNKKMHDIIHCRKPDGAPLSLHDCPILTVIKTGAIYASDKEVFIRKDGTMFPISVRSSPIMEGSTVAACVTAFQDITQRRQTEEERERLVAQLQEALEKIITLRGLIPICASCKNVRDDKGYWTQVEAYVSEHSLAEFSHGICPDCAKRLYPKYYSEDGGKNSQA